MTRLSTADLPAETNRAQSAQVGAVRFAASAKSERARSVPQLSKCGTRTTRMIRRQKRAVSLGQVAAKAPAAGLSQGHRGIGPRLAYVQRRVVDKPHLHRDRVRRRLPRAGVDAPCRDDVRIGDGRWQSRLSGRVAAWRDARGTRHRRAHAAPRPTVRQRIPVQSAVTERALP